MTVKFSEEFLAKVRALISKYKNIEELNEFLEDTTGIMDFFKSPYELKEFKQFLNKTYIFNYKTKDLGDFQTPSHLTDKICKYLVDVEFAPDAVLEPTCGEGNFVISAIEFFPSLKYVYCVDVQGMYEWLLKLNILKLSSKQDINVKIEFHRDNIFTHRFSNRFTKFLEGDVQNLLILGNPPWVTSSELSILSSDNLPPKANIKGYRGIDVITGKGNFDIAEYIILRMIQEFSDKKGKIAMLCKTSVIKNIVRDMRKLSLKLSNIQALLIDAKKEFNISGEGALFLADIGSGRGDFCKVSSLYQPDHLYKKYGWIDNKFVSDIELYEKHKQIDGQSPVVWRQGVKHDAAKVMILTINADGILFNGLQEYVDVEDDLLYPFVKGSETRKNVIKNTVNRIIITQSSLGDDTSCIALKYPKLWNYLVSHSKYLDKRKSVVYRRRPRFSLFGVGDYSFKPYKIAISGFYKTPNFSLVLPINGKPVMLDDTCYYLSFNNFNNAFFTWILLNTDAVKKFLSSIVFLDSKRPYTKEILMRINIQKLAEIVSFDELFDIYEENLKTYLKHKFDEKEFFNFRVSLKNAASSKNKTNKSAF